MGDKGTGKAEKITITSDKGRLSEEEIERMVREAEEFAEEDKAIKARIDARNGLEGYAYNLKNTLSDEEKGVKDKIDEEDAETLEEAIQETLDWLDENQEADLEEYQEKQKELEGVANPIMQKVYAAAGGGGGDGGDDGDFEEDDFDDFDDDHDELRAASFSRDVNALVVKDGPCRVPPLTPVVDDIILLDFLYRRTEVIIHLISYNSSPYA